MPELATHRTRGLLAAVLIAPVLATVGATAPAQALDNGLALTPPMGFNDWNSFGCDIDAQDFYDMADLFVETGLRDVGYEYINIDDCWMEGRDAARGTTERATSGRSMTAPYRLLPDRTYFPDVDEDGSGAIEADEEYNGIKALTDYVHERGLKLGIYSSAGTTTCQGLAGSLGYEEIDAQTFAEWGIDYLKLDTCGSHSTTTMDGRTVSYPDTVEGYEARWSTMRDALLEQDRPIVFSICDFTTAGQSWTWGADVGNLWRTTTDISASWSSVVSNFKQTIVLSEYAGPGAWNDPDMLEVGVDGALTPRENRSHFSLWAMMAAPLIIGADLREIDPDSLSVLLNDEVIAVDQDPLGEPATVVSQGNGRWVLSRPLANGDVAVALFNETGTASSISTTALATGAESASAYRLRDLWSGATTHTSGRISASVPAHGTVMYRLTSDGGAASEDALVSVDATASAQTIPHGGLVDVSVTVTNDGRTALQQTSVDLAVPSGWHRELRSISGKSTLASGASRTAVFRVTAPAVGDDPIEAADLEAVASWRQRTGSRSVSSSVRVTALTVVDGSWPTADTTADGDALFGQVGDILAIASAGAGVSNPTRGPGFTGAATDEYAAIYAAGGASSTSTAEVTVSQRGSTASGDRAGIMMRNDMAGNGQPVGVALYVSGSNSVALVYATDGGTAYTSIYPTSGFFGGTTVPAGEITLRLMRSGSTYTAYWSSDGTTFNQLGTRGITLPDVAATTPQDVGVFHASGTPGEATEAQFQGFSTS